jgi:CheY-like chemotaxis protein
MRKVLLVVDDYNELIAIEGFFRRLGFDVLSVGKDVLVADALLKFIPDLVLASVKGRHVDGIKLASRIFKAAPSARVALIYGAGEKPVLPPEARSRVDTLIELPVKPTAIISLVCRLLNLDPDPILEKFARQNVNKPKANERSKVFLEEAEGIDNKREGESEIKASGIMVWDPQATPGQAVKARSERSDKYDQFLQTISGEGSVEGTLSHLQTAEFIKALKKHTEVEKEQLEKLHMEKCDFVQKLFEVGAKKE